ncbi:MAG TPA: M1 family metallopeptidase [Gemmatimonadaceae bacterium]|nr:M1 family metallopeptidase [Gemmatimonadaceae bacterium]
MPSLFVFLLALQQHAPMPTGNTTPPSGDTVGYWQQRIAYTITATLDEAQQRVRARARMSYVNNSPDTLREIYVHQYLNAFRPRSTWSAIDEREGRERFQRLRDPDYGYERFTAPVRVNGTAVTVDYPGAPDSTVARFALPHPLAPGDSVVVDFEWDARPSIIARRQGRRQRHWDLAQWYPKVAVYDRAGWEYNALQPAGEFYGEYGSYDVTLVVAQDQVLGATGVPVSGDPGWAAASRGGVVRAATRAYDVIPVAPTVMIPQGYKAVRYFARDVHHFAWSASPNYRYEGGIYVRQTPADATTAWDTVSVHVLYQPGDDSTWGGQRAVSRTINALRWLESVYGPYAYPQMTVLHRIDGGGTEFPMMQMNGSASQGLILHEGGHVFTYGILGNNEWRSGWMDEGLTSYQTDWAQGGTAQEYAASGRAPQPQPMTGYRSLATRMTLWRSDALGIDQALTDLQGRSEPIGTAAQDFRDFNTYNDMIYDRAQVMYGQLRDVLGDSAFVAFLHDYYARWKLEHVDERAMRASAERVSGKDLGWFFEQWVHRTGVTDYSLDRVRATRTPDGRWVTEAVVTRRGQYSHPIPVGVRTSTGWTIAHATDPRARSQIVRIVTTEPPLTTRIDPLHTSWDWNRMNDRPRSAFMAFHNVRLAADWPLLEQTDREKEVWRLRPALWYSDIGGATVGINVNASYLATVDEGRMGVAFPTLTGAGSDDNTQVWLWFRNPLLLRPMMGWFGGFARLDGVEHYHLGWSDTLTTLRGARGLDVRATYAMSHADSRLTPELWTHRRSMDVSASGRWRLGPSNRGYWFVAPALLGGADELDPYVKGEIAVGRVQTVGRNGRIGVRAYYGGEANAPGQRALLVSAQDPIATFGNHWWRPAGAILKRPNVNWLPLGGAALRGYRWDLAADNAAAVNVDLARQLGTSTWARGRDGTFTFRLHGFADIASPSDDGVARTLGDAGVGLSVTGRMYDRPVFIRIDSPFYVSAPEFAIDRGHAGSGKFAPRWAITFNDAW